MKGRFFFTHLRRVLAFVSLCAMTSVSASAQERVLHSLANNGKDATDPLGGLIFDSHGHLYGTARAGGVYNFGAVFELTPTVTGGWSEKVLHSFNSTNGDGTNPYASLILDADGNLYGTSCYGGAYQNGTVFELTPSSSGSWTETVLHSFTGKDGGCSFAPLIFDAAGDLYGTTYQGGAYGWGTVFELIRSAGGTWTEKVLHNFNNNARGYYLQNGLISDASGNLYGTAHGGSSGIVFELIRGATGGWSEKVLHTFHGPDGCDPEALIFDAAGNLYGTTYTGGEYDDGTVFELSSNTAGGWTEKVLHSFNGSDGDYCYAGVVFDTAGNLYGTMVEGGTYNHGTVFELTPGVGNWTEKTLHSFNSKDGSYTWAPLILDSTRNVYEVTASGGATGYGTVFEIKQ